MDGYAEVVRFVKAANPTTTRKDGDDNWTPTVVNPSVVGNMTDKALFWIHIIVWLTAMVLSAVTNFTATDTMANKTGTDSYSGVTSTTTTIAVLGGVSSILGVLVLVFSAAWFTADDFAGRGEGLFANVAIQFFTLFGTTATFYTFSRAAEQPSNGFYGLALSSVIFLVYAQVLLYCTSSAMGVAALPRAFIPSLAASVQFISALAVSSGDFVPSATTEQKTVAWLIPILTVVALMMMFGIRIGTKRGGFLSRLPAAAINALDGVERELTVSNIKNRPFLRSLFLTPYMCSGILSVYKLSFVKLDTDPTSYVFAVFGMLLNFAIIGVVFNPSAELVGIADDEMPQNKALIDQAPFTI